MGELNFRPLDANEIDVRATDTKYQGSCTLLLYMDSRAAVRVLNETVGPFNWQMEYHEACDGKIYGRLSIWDEDKKQWVAKEDTGEESNIEARKGESSDIVKRCLARWGYDYLYTAPRVKIKCPPEYYYNDRLTMTFRVSQIEYDKGKITYLRIVDRNDMIVFDWHAYGYAKPKDIDLSKDNVRALKDYCRSLTDSGRYDRKEILKFYNYYEDKVSNYKQLRLEKAWEGWLERTKEKAA